MDPNAALNEAETAVQLSNHPIAVERLLHYYQWRVRGGFEPTNGDNRAEALGNRLLDSM